MFITLEVVLVVMVLLVEVVGHHQQIQLFQRKSGAPGRVIRLYACMRYA
jgi:hypothetical protein